MDRQILQLVQDEFPLLPRVWDAVGTRLGIPAQEALLRVKRLQEAEFIRSIAPVLESARVTDTGIDPRGCPGPCRCVCRRSQRSSPPIPGSRTTTSGVTSSISGSRSRHRTRPHSMRSCGRSEPKTGLGEDAFLDLPIRRKFKIDVRYTLDTCPRRFLMDDD